ncbi:class I SAM-dependent methyltransferase [Litorivicinus sp.]|nr:class I SAM-dependent methyltransferase [Litorivicinus sp.]
MGEIDLLRSLPKASRNIEKRKGAKDAEVVRRAKLFGFDYWDGPREFGYGGYRYDGRWRPVAQDIIAHYGLQTGMRCLDIGCGKGFLLHDLREACPGLEVFGLDVSEYALANTISDIGNVCVLGSADELPYESDFFDLVLSINTLHNLPRPRLVEALREITRVSRGDAFVQVDSYFTAEQKEIFESWVLTAEFHDYPDEWVRLFDEAGYRGDYFWTIIS